MTPETWIAGIAAVIALVALYFTGIAALAAKDQTRIQRQLRIDAAQPYVWVDLREDTKSGTSLLLVIGNSGPTIATNVRVNISSALPAEEGTAEMIRIVQRRLETGFQSLTPGREIRWHLGRGFNLLAKTGSHSYRFTINAEGPFGPLEPLVYTVDMDDWREMRDDPDGSLHLVRKSVDRLATRLDTLTAAVVDK